MQALLEKNVYIEVKQRNALMWTLRATLMVLVLHYSSTETNHLIKWQILNPPIVFGQDVVLFCNASLAKKCCMNTATWMKGFDVIVHHRASTNVSKYIHKKQRNGFLLIIKNFDEDDINQQYTCLYDFSSYSAVLGIDRHNFKYIPNEDELDTNIKKISDNTFVADVIFFKVYPLPECILVRNQKKINTNVTVGEETKIGHFYKIKLHLVYKIHNNNCMDSVVVLCTIGKDEIVVYNNKISNCSDINDSLGSDKNSLDHNILVVFILSGLFLLATFTAACVRMWKKRRLSSRTTFSRIEGSVANSTRSDNRSVRFWKKEGNDYGEDSELTPLLERDSDKILLIIKRKSRCQSMTIQSYGPAQKEKDVINMVNYAKIYDKDYMKKLASDTLINNARHKQKIWRLKSRPSVSALPCTNVSVSDIDVIKGSSMIPTWGARKRSRISITGKQGSSNE